MEAGQQRSEISRFIQKPLQKCGAQKRIDYPKSCKDLSHVDRENKSSEIFPPKKKKKKKKRLFSVFLGSADAFISIRFVIVVC